MPYCGVPINCNAFITALAPDVDTFHTCLAWCSCSYSTWWKESSHSCNGNITFDHFSGHFTGYFGRVIPRNKKATFCVMYFIYIGLGYIYRIRIGLGPKSDDCFTLCSESKRIARYTRETSGHNSATDLRRSENDDGYTLCSENERIARYTRETSDQNSATDLKRPKNDDCYTLCSENERIARYTRNERPQTRSGSSTSERKCVSVV